MTYGDRKRPSRLDGPVPARPVVSQGTREFVGDLLLIVWLGLMLGVILAAWFGVL